MVCFFGSYSYFSWVDCFECRQSIDLSGKSFTFSGRSLKYIETWLLLDSVLDLSWFALGNLGFVNCFVTFAYQKEMSLIFQFCQYCIRIFFDVYGRLMYDIHLIASKYIYIYTYYFTAGSIAEHFFLHWLWTFGRKDGLILLNHTWMFYLGKSRAVALY